MKRTGGSLCILALCLTAATPALGNTATALIVEGQPLPGAPADHLVDAISNSAVNHAGGYAFTVNTLGPSGAVSRVWGAPAGGAGEVLRSESILGDYQQNSFESFFGLADDGAVAYSAINTNLANGHTGLDSAWLDDLFVAMEEQAYPHEADRYWSFASRPGVTAGGMPYFVGGLTDVPGGGTAQRGLFSGLDATPDLMGGDFTGGVPYPVEAMGIDFDVRFSAGGSFWIDAIKFSTGDTNNDDYVLFNGLVITFDSPDPVREGNAISPGVGGLPGEHWDNFDFFGVTEAGLIMITGDSDADTGLDEFILLGQEIVLREGDLVGDRVLSGAIEGAYLNEDGDWAAIWDVMADGGGTAEALLLNGQILLMEGDAVDMDGDGQVEETSILDNFTGISSLTLSDRDPEGRVRLYFTADVTVPGAPRRASVPALFADLESLGMETVEERSDRQVIEGGFELAYLSGTGAGAPATPAHALLGNYPNPFNPSTSIAFNLAGDTHAVLEILTVDGRLLTTLLDADLGAGDHEVTWRGLDAAGRSVASGVYLARLRAGDWFESRRLVLLK